MRHDTLNTVTQHIGAAETSLADATNLANGGEFTSAKAIVEAIHGLTRAVLAIATLELERQLSETEVVVVDRRG